MERGTVYLENKCVESTHEEKRKEKKGKRKRKKGACVVLLQEKKNNRNFSFSSFDYFRIFS